jgi:hypothetical protein
MAAKATTAPAITAPAPDGVMAFGNALTEKGVDSELATRALYAYRRSQGLIPVGLN